MKVSRKVGRRKHSRSSFVSRRRFRNNKNKKSSYKKRYTKTHRGGCWSEKKGGARSRKYGHKRGKRFHRGGVSVADSVDNLTFYVKKSGTISEEPQRFDVTITLEGSGSDSDVVTLTLTRISSSSKEITFTIKGVYYEIIQLLVSPNQTRNVSGLPNGGIIIDFKNLKDNTESGTYDFYRNARNRGSFIEIKNKLEHLKELNSSANPKLNFSQDWNQGNIHKLTESINNSSPYPLNQNTNPQLTYRGNVVDENQQPPPLTA